MTFCAQHHKNCPTCSCLNPISTEYSSDLKLENEILREILVNVGYTGDVDSIIKRCKKKLKGVMISDHLFTATPEEDVYAD